MTEFNPITNASEYTVFDEGTEHAGEHSEFIPDNPHPAEFVPYEVTVHAPPPDGVIPLLRVANFWWGEVLLEWNVPVPDPLDYRVRWARVGEEYPAWDDPEHNHYIGEPSYVAEHLSPGDYKFQVRARYKGWSGPWIEAGAFRVG